MDAAQLSTWMEGYVRAWNSNDPADIRALFSDDAEYLTEPYATPWRGREAILQGWLADRDEPGQAEFRWSPLVVTDDLAVIQGATEYRTEPPRTYSNLWVVRL